MDKSNLKEIGEELYGRWGWQTQMAKELGVNISTLKRWLVGTTPIPHAVWLALNYLLCKKIHPEIDYSEIENKSPCEHL